MARFMARSLSNVVDNLSEGIDKTIVKYVVKYKYSVWIKYKYWECFLEYTTFKDDLIE